eukprot:2960147-Rhodomonas_salina.2
MSNLNWKNNHIKYLCWNDEESQPKLADYTNWVDGALRATEVVGCTWIISAIKKYNLLDELIPKMVGPRDLNAAGNPYYNSIVSKQAVVKAKIELRSFGLQIKCSADDHCRDMFMGANTLIAKHPLHPLIEWKLL